MNKLIEKTIVEILDAPSIKSDTAFKELSVAQTTEDIVKAVNSAWKKTKEMYLAVGLKLYQIEQKDKNQFLEVREKLKKSIHNGTITYLKKIGEHSNWLESRISSLPDNLRLIYDVVKDLDKRDEIVKKINLHSSKDENYLPQTKTFQLLNALTDNKNIKQIAKKKLSRPVCATVRATLSIWDENKEDITSALNEAKEKLKRKGITIYVDPTK